MIACRDLIANENNDVIVFGDISKSLSDSDDCGLLSSHVGLTFDICPVVDESSGLVQTHDFERFEHSTDDTDELSMTLGDS